MDPSDLYSAHLDPPEVIINETSWEEDGWMLAEVSSRLDEIQALFDKEGKVTEEERQEFDDLAVLEGQLKNGEEPDEDLVSAFRSRRWDRRPSTPHLLCWSPPLLEQGDENKHNLEDEEDWMEGDIIYLRKSSSSRDENTYVYGR